MKTFLLEKLGRLAEPGDNGIFELTTKSWDVFHKEQNSFIVVQFLSPDCSNCQRVEPIYEDLGNHVYFNAVLLTHLTLFGPDPKEKLIRLHKTA